MRATALINELKEIGIHLSRDGDDLIADVLPIADIEHHIGCIKANKLELLAVLRRRERELESMVSLLERGWTWFETHPNDPRSESFEVRWIALLREYESAYRALINENQYATLDAWRR